MGEHAKCILKLDHAEMIISFIIFHDRGDERKRTEERQPMVNILLSASRIRFRLVVSRQEKRERRERGERCAQSTYHSSLIELGRRSIFPDDVKTSKCSRAREREMIGGKPFDVESLLRDCAVKKKRPIHDTIQIYDQQQHQQQATDLSLGKEKLQPGRFQSYERHRSIELVRCHSDDHDDSSNSSSNSSSISTMRSSIDAYRQHFFNSASSEAAKSFLLSMRNFTSSSSTSTMGGSNSNIQIKKTKRRSRAAFSHAQVIELERRFAQQKYLSSTERAELATLLSVSDMECSVLQTRVSTKGVQASHSFSLLATRTASEDMVGAPVLGHFQHLFRSRFQNRRYKAKRKQLLSQVNPTNGTRHAPVTVLVYENHAFSGNSSSSSSSRLAHHKPPLMIPSMNF